MSAKPSEPLVEMRDARKVYQSSSELIFALAGVSIDIRSGEFIAVMGPSGSGKSTLANMIGCLDVPTAGSCRIGGQETMQLDAVGRARLRRKHMGFVFQGFNLLNYADAVANVELPLTYRKIGRRERRDRAEAALAAVGLGDRMKHTPAELSGGQQQRVAIARAIVTRPSIIVADEPTAALDSTTGHEILSLFERFNGDEGITIILVTHDREISRRAQRRIAFEAGRIVDDSGVSSA